MLSYIWALRNRTPQGDEGASAVEYGLLVAAIAAVIIAVVFVIGHYVHGAFKQTCDSFASNSVSHVGGGSCT
jgi:pilus assembly protein Flp/PilA